MHMGPQSNRGSQAAALGTTSRAYSMGYDNRIANSKPQLDAEECPEYMEGYDACEAELAKY